MRKRGRKRTFEMTESELRSYRKKTMGLPSRVVTDPFMMKKYYINKNGRMVVFDRGRWKAV